MALICKGSLSSKVHCLQGQSVISSHCDKERWSLIRAVFCPFTGTKSVVFYNGGLLSMVHCSETEGWSLIRAIFCQEFTVTEVVSYKDGLLSGIHSTKRGGLLDKL